MTLEADDPPAASAASAHDPLRAALAQLTEGVIVADVAGRITFVNEAAARLHGVERLDVAPEAYVETYRLLTEDGRPHPTAELPLTRAVRGGETVVEARWRIRRPDGSEVLAVGSARPVRGPDGAQVGAVLTLRDDTARAAAAAALRERDALASRLRAAFEQSPVSTVVYDAAGRPLATNPAFERLWGAAMADVPPEYSVLTDPQLEAAGVLPLIRRAFAGESVTLPALRYEMESAVGRGRVLWTEAHLYPVRDAAGAVEQVVLTHEDVTARREAEAALAETAGRTARLQALTAALAGALTADDVAEVVVAQGVAATGATAGVLAVRDAASPDEGVILRQTGFPAAVADRFARFPLAAPVPTASCIRTGEPVFLSSREGVLDRFPGSPDVWDALPARALVAVPLVTAGEAVGALTFTFPEPRALPAADREFFLTLGRQCAQALERTRLFAAERAARAEVEQLNAELRRAVADLEAVLEVVPIGIGIARDPECRHIRVNPAVAGQLGIAADANASKSAASAPDLPFRVFQHGREVPPEALPMQRAARERVTLAGLEYDIVHADGRVVRLLEYSAPLVDDAGAVRGAVGAFIDITERARLVEAERSARAEAERANRAKSEFLAVMSHELRTPLNAIGGYAELLAMGIRGPVTEQQREDLERIQRSQRHLLGLINEVLNYARLETGSVRYDVTDVGVARAVAAVESLVLPQVREKSLAFDVSECDPALVVRADREKLQQILVNLLSNAVKFTGRGGRIDVAAHGVADAARGDVVAIAVRDTGVGIPADKHEAVFEPFVQVGRTLHSPGEGTGLGLAISRDLARGMGGDLTVESAPGAGSTFTLVLPRAPEGERTA